MILGSLDQSLLTDFLGQREVFRRAFDWIRRMPSDAPEGITELEGGELYVNVHGYKTKPREDCKWESHRHTADLQFCISGGEAIDWTPIRHPGPSQNYDATKDFELWPASVVVAETIRLAPRQFVIFVPGELHRPVVADGINSRIRKLVFKINARFLQHP